MLLINSFATNFLVVLLHGGHSHSHEAIGFALWTGMVAAVLHVISGPDHLAAVTPLAVEAKKKVWKIGLLWGTGHLVGMLIIGLLFLFFKDFLPIEAVSAHSEQLVALVLIAVGLWALYSVFFKKDKIHTHPHIHVDDEPYIHIHEHDHSVEGSGHQHTHKKKEKQNLWSSFGIGVIHGLAGVAHFILLLPVLGFEHQSDSLQYIIGFGLGTIFAMTIYTFLLGLVSKHSKKLGGKSLFQAVRLSSGVFALMVGFYWLYLTF